MSFGSGLKKSLAQTVVSFNKIGRRFFGEKKTAAAAQIRDYFK